MIDQPNKLLELISNCLKPKIIEKKEFGEVFTPIKFINNEMLYSIEKYYLHTYHKNIWSDPNITWYDPAAGMGNYPVAIYYKLFDGLKDIIPDVNNRKKHIVENQLYMGELNKKNCYLIKQIFNLDNKYKLNLYEGDTLSIDLMKTFNRKTFNIVIGNPPYNELLTKIGAKPLYNKFIDYYMDKCSIMSFIIPSRWMAGGKGLDKFRQSMLSREDIVYIKHFDDASKIFGNTVDIKGGVNYFLIDKSYNGLCEYNGNKIKLNTYDVIVDSKYYSIIEKVKNHPSITSIYTGRCYGIESNDKRLVKENNKDENLLKCYVSKQKGEIMYIDKKEIKRDYNYYKIITARASHKHGSGFGNIFIGNVCELHNNSYISFKVNSELEAKSLLSYMKCKLPNFLLSLRKVSQDISESTCKWIPLVPLNKIWSDGEIYNYFNLSENEIKMITDKKIIGYKNK